MSAMKVIFGLALAACASTTSAIELTADNFEEKTAGKVRVPSEPMGSTQRGQAQHAARRQIRCRRRGVLLWPRTLNCRVVFECPMQCGQSVWPFVSSWKQSHLSAVCRWELSGRRLALPVPCCRARGPPNPSLTPALVRPCPVRADGLHQVPGALVRPLQGACRAARPCVFLRPPPSRPPNHSPNHSPLCRIRAPRRQQRTLH